MRRLLFTTRLSFCLIAALALARCEQFPNGSSGNSNGLTDEFAFTYLGEDTIFPGACGLANGNFVAAYYEGDDHIAFTLTPFAGSGSYGSSATVLDIAYNGENYAGPAPCTVLISQESDRILGDVTCNFNGETLQGSFSCTP